MNEELFLGNITPVNMFTRQESLSVVLPMFNEEENVEFVVTQITETLCQITNYYEIVVVDDGSIDHTGSILERLSKSIPYLKVVTHPNNQGYGAALRSGIKAVSGNWTILMDGDGQFSAKEIIPLIGAMAGVDCVLGARNVRCDSFMRRVFGRIGNSLACWILKTRILDINCGLKLFRTSDLQVLSLYSVGGVINTEILSKLISQGSKLRQMTVEHLPRIKGKQTGGHPLVILRIVVEGLRLAFQKSI